MDEVRLDAIQEYMDRATRGPWEGDAEMIIGYLDGRRVDIAECRRGFNGGPANEEEAVWNMRFIVAARDDLPVLLAELRRLRAKVAGMDPQSSNLVGCVCCAADLYNAEPHAADCLWVECGGKP